ncbi:MAG: YggS family pyridoxal phosphate-dependent enzyme [Duncaniella sp.]|nr:YggS family pyridoxal phosphate-dependent enzyme [Muribaculum sp.]MCM1256046.1 YggS family pyridoxal phosphate-dependent enzyme [Duncaniella sp.]
MSVKENLRQLLSTIPQGVELVAVSKFHPLEALQEAYDEGQRMFGESRANELIEKAKQMPKDVRWHFIGHLQTNKVRQILPYVTLIHSVDSERLLRLINSESLKLNRITDVLMQLHVAKEETKFGFTPEELLDTVTTTLLSELDGIRIVGVMGMASNVDDEARIRQDFREIRQAFYALKSTVFATDSDFNIISMGMSHDWEIAAEEGSNMIRVGTNIFGEREY